ncbi:MAG: helix-turn-helix domain-containing protein [Alphaproteobacteria bacterium]
MKLIPIGQAAKQSGVKVSTIRWYEDQGLIDRLPRSDSGRRLFDPATLDRLSFIRHAREMGFALDDLRALLDLADHPDRDCAEADKIAARQIERIDRQIAQLQALKAELNCMVSACPGETAEKCRVIETLADHDAHCHHDHGDARDI